MVAGGLVLLFPFRGLEQDLGRDASRPDALQIAYLEAWLTVRPGRSQLRYLLARQLVAADDLDRARSHLRHLGDHAESQLRTRALLLELDIGLRELQAMSLGHPERPDRLLALREQFRVLLAGDLPADIGQELAQRAAALGATGLAVDWYRRLLASRPVLSAAAWEAAASNVLQWGEHVLAARLLMQARSVATTRAEQRRLFIAALRTLQAASLFDEALALAEAQLGALADDTVTLEYLTRLALAADRPAIAQRYAIRLLRISLLPAAIERLQRAGQPVPEHWIALSDRIAPAVIAVQATGVAPSAAPDHERTARLPFDDNLYTLSYDVFIANGNLRDALLVARAAVRQAPRNLAWRRRLAQVAEWSALPELALEQWHAIARATGEAEAWSQVKQRATQLRATDLRVEALRIELARRPDDAATLNALVRAYEDLGQPGDALALLRPVLAQRARTPARREQLDLLAAVAERAGDVAARRSALQALLRDFDAHPDDALRLAALEYAAGDEAAAFAALAIARTHALSDVVRHRDYWQAVAELARVSGRRDEALRAYRLLLGAGVAGEDLLVNTAGMLEDEDPREAARLYDLAWQRFNRPELAAQALYLLLRTGDSEAVRAWLAQLTPAQLASLEGSARFLVQRATVRLADGRVRAAVADARRAFALQPEDAGIEALLVWTLIAARDAPALRAQLSASSRAAVDEPQLWGPFAAGWLALQAPRQALRFLRLQAAAGGDTLWMLSYADALDQLGQRDLAWNLRSRVWRKRDAIAAAGRSPQERLDLQRRLLPLAAVMVGGDAARARLQALLAADPKSGTGPTREAALAYWIARERSDIARAWLLGQYAQALERPAWAELSTALAENDGERIETLLDTVADWLPVYDRIEAADRVGRTAQAQTLAFDALASRPDSDEVHRRLTDRVVGDRAGTAPQFVGLGLRSLNQRPIDETTWLADASLRLTPRMMLSASQAVTTRRSIDGAQLVDPPGRDATAQVDLAYDLGSEAAARLWLHQRDGLARAWGWRAQGDWRAASRLSLSAVVGQGQPASDNAYLRVGAVRDLVGLGAYSRLSQREFAAVSVETSRFAAQGSGAIGDGRVLRLEAGHYLRTEYPDLSIRLGVADLHYAAAPGVAGALLPLLPVVSRATASNALLLPASTQQVGATLVFGETARERYTRAWRPFGVLGITQDRNSGTDYAWTLGATGSVFGADELTLTASAGSGLGVQAPPFRQFGLRYRWMF